MKKIISILLIFMVFNVLGYDDFDHACPEISNTNKYIQVPMFHDLEAIAAVENISQLNTQNELMGMFQGSQFTVYYELLAPYDPNKDLLIMIPGGPGQSHTFIHSFYQIEGFPELAKKYNVLAMDHRGVGCSRYVGPSMYPAESLLMRQAASDIEFIRKSYGEEKKINVFGYSYGSMLAQTYALLYPNNLDKLFLGGAFSAASDFVDAMITFETRVLNASPEMKENYEYLKLYYPEYAHKILRAAGEYMYEYRGFKVDLVEVTKETVRLLKLYDYKSIEEILNIEEQGPMDWMMRSISCIELFPSELENNMFPIFGRTMINVCKEFEGRFDRFDYTLDLENISAPTFIWGGEYDHVTTAVAMRRMSLFIPNNYLYIDEHIGHGIDKPKCLVEMMDKFFSSGIDESVLDNIKSQSFCADEPKLKDIQEEGNESHIARMGIL